MIETIVEGWARERYPFKREWYGGSLYPKRLPFAGEADCEPDERLAAMWRDMFGRI